MTTLDQEIEMIKRKYEELERKEAKAISEKLWSEKLNTHSVSPDTVLIPFIDHIIDVSVVVCGDDYGNLNAFGKIFQSPYRLRGEKGIIFMGFSESSEGLENDPIYVLVGHHKGNVYATVLNSREMIG